MMVSGETAMTSASGTKLASTGPQFPVTGSNPPIDAEVSVHSMQRVPAGFDAGLDAGFDRLLCLADPSLIRHRFRLSKISG
ncbi:hypothetical protein MBOU_50840 [Mycobacterium bourgelatii]|uniref:Uncharacterized protein n=1 Tax=Mycobacterium bourgelatii TaxID=1273442 RepID=A0A7I9YWU0_MYCBU|nr:hypothetical protein MBOU_50840 [Mycobacterium bourgelatii]